MVNIDHVMGFNGATAMKPWKSVTILSKRTRPRGFNGATAMKPWKRNYVEGSASWYTTLQWGHGDEAVEEALGSTRRCARTTCFNGATAMKPWKRISVYDVALQISTLQWGHGDEAVEEISCDARAVAVFTASMGPRR